MSPRTRFGLVALLLGVLLPAGCGDNRGNGGQNGQNQATGTLITTHRAAVESIEILQETLGRISSPSAPAIAAEVNGRITAIHKDVGEQAERGELLLEIDPEPYELALRAARTDVRRLQATVANQRQELQRNRDLLAEDFVTQSEVDAAETELTSLRQQLESARVQVQAAELDLRNTRVNSPVNGQVDQRLVSTGDFARRGEPLFRLVGQDQLRVILPFPETVAGSLKTGQKVRLRAPLTDNGQVEGVISDLRPALLGTSRSIEAIVQIPNPGGWRAGGSVNAQVLIDTRRNVVVPNTALVQRPAGEVVYVITQDTAYAREVNTGLRRSASTEILAGLEQGEVIALDGAGFLSDGAPVRTSQGREEP